MAESVTTYISGTLAALVSLLTWLPLMTILSHGAGPYVGEADFTTWVFFLAPLSLGFSLMIRGSPIFGAWLIALTPIISSICFFLLVIGIVGSVNEEAISTGFALLWLLPAIANFLWNKEAITDESLAEDSVLAPIEFATIRRNREAITEELDNRQLHFKGSSCTEINPEEPLAEDSFLAPNEFATTLEANDIQKFIATASKERIFSAHANQADVSRFFNAIRYGQTARVRQAISASPLLILAKDVYGNTPIDVAEKENSTELLDFFRMCLAKK